MSALVVGGSSGIGKHLAGALLAQGHDIVIASRNLDRLRDAKVALDAIAPRVSTIVCDVADAASVAAMVDYVTIKHGCPDILVNSAGFAVYRTFEQSSAAEIERLVDVNLLGALRCIHGFLPTMMKRGSGHIVIIGSIAGLIPLTPCATYSAAKHALTTMSELLRFELQDAGINVHLVSPGRVETPFFDHPTFRFRRRRPEAENTVPIEKVTAGVMRAIETGKFHTIVPRSLGQVAWLRALWPDLADRFLGKVLLKRIREARDLNIEDQTEVSAQ